MKKLLNNVTCVILIFCCLCSSFVTGNIVANASSEIKTITLNDASEPIVGAKISYPTVDPTANYTLYSSKWFYLSNMNWIEIKDSNTIFEENVQYRLVCSCKTNGDYIFADNGNLKASTIIGDVKADIITSTSTRYFVHFEYIFPSLLIREEKPEASFYATGEGCGNIVIKGDILDIKYKIHGPKKDSEWIYPIENTIFVDNLQSYGNPVYFYIVREGDGITRRNSEQMSIYALKYDKDIIKITTTPCTSPDNINGKITLTYPTNRRWEFKKSDQTSWIMVPSTRTAARLTAGNYDVRVAMQDGIFASDPIRVTVKSYAEAQISSITISPGDGLGEKYSIVTAEGGMLIAPENTFSASFNRKFLYWSDGKKKYFPGNTYFFSRDTELNAVWGYGINKVNIKGLIAPSVDVSPATDLIKVSENCGIANKEFLLDNGYDENDIKNLDNQYGINPLWLDSNGNIENSSFENGKDYTISFMLYANDGYFFDNKDKIEIIGLEQAQDYNTTIISGNLLYINALYTATDHTHIFEAKIEDGRYLKYNANCVNPMSYYKSCTKCGLSSKGFGDGEALFTINNPLGHIDTDNNDTCDRCHKIIYTPAIPSLTVNGKRGIYVELFSKLGEELDLSAAYSMIAEGDPRYNDAIPIEGDIDICWELYDSDTITKKSEEHGSDTTFFSETLGTYYYVLSIKNVTVIKGITKTESDTIYIKIKVLESSAENIGSDDSSILDEFYDENDPAIIGDINGDAEINMQDVVVIQKYIAVLTQLNKQQMILSDVNFDRDITMVDVTILQKYIAKLIDRF